MSIRHSIRLIKYTYYYIYTLVCLSVPLICLRKHTDNVATKATRSTPQTHNAAIDKVEILLVLFESIVTKLSFAVGVIAELIIETNVILVCSVSELVIVAVKVTGCVVVGSVVVVNGTEVVVGCSDGVPIK